MYDQSLKFAFALGQIDHFHKSPFLDPRALKRAFSREKNNSISATKAILTTSENC